MSTHPGSVDAFHSYLTEIRDRPLLNSGGEVELARRLERERLELFGLLVQVPWARMQGEASEEGFPAPVEPVDVGTLEAMHDPSGESEEAEVPEDSRDRSLPGRFELLMQLDRAREQQRAQLTKAKGERSRQQLQRWLDETECDLRHELEAVLALQPRVDAMVRQLDRLVDRAEQKPRSSGGARPSAGATRLARQLGMSWKRLRKLRDDIRAAQRKARRTKEQIVEANLRLVVYHAKRLAGPTAPLEDLVQEGNLGLMRAVDKYNPRLGYRFSTYASWWIRQAITRGLPEQARTIRLPVHVLELQRRVRRAVRVLEQQLGRTPTEEEIAVEADLAVDRVTTLEDTARDTLSLDMPVGRELDHCLGDIVAAPDLRPADVETERHELAAHARDLLEAFPAREAMVLRLRFGLDARAPHTLQQIGDMLGVTRERARQIEAKALRRLQPAARCRALA